MTNLIQTDINKEVNNYLTEEVRDLTDASFIVRFSRNGLTFKPGQHLVVGIPEIAEGREYSIYSGVNDPYIEILVREVEGGSISSKLRKLVPGDQLTVDGPFGFFMYNTMPPEFKKFVFIASGTGIAPFHSFIRTYPKANYLLVHGIRYINESYGSEDYLPERYIACTSGDNKGGYHGRLTSYIKHAEFEKDVFFYFCGNNSMILEAMDILQKRGFSHSQMYTEVYF